jgi:hypothetical protein
MLDGQAFHETTRPLADGNRRLERMSPLRIRFGQPNLEFGILLKRFPFEPDPTPEVDLRQRRLHANRNSMTTCHRFRGLSSPELRTRIDRIERETLHCVRQILRLPETVGIQRNVGPPHHLSVEVPVCLAVPDEIERRQKAELYTRKSRRSRNHVNIRIFNELSPSPLSSFLFFFVICPARVFNPHDFKFAEDAVLLDLIFQDFRCAYGEAVPRISFGEGSRSFFSGNGP